MSKQQQALKLIEQLESYHDSDEIADALRVIVAEPEIPGREYWIGEAAEQIDGLYELARGMARLLKKIARQEGQA